MPDTDGELTTEDVQLYTKGRLNKDDDETKRLLNAALATCRRYCGWRVTPVKSEELTLDGPGGRRLSLPTLHLVELTSVIEDDVTLDLSGLQWSPLGFVRKKSGGCWSSDLGAITVTMTHGFEDAADWQAAVLELVDRMSAMPGAVVGNSGPLVEKTVDDVSYRWVLNIGQNPQLFDMLNHTLLDPYRLVPLA